MNEDITMWRILRWLSRNTLRLVGMQPLPLPPPTLPKGTRYFNPTVERGRRGVDSFGLLIVEKEPTSRTIFGAKGTSYYLPFPYIIFIIRFGTMHHNGKLVYCFTKLQVGFSMTSLTSTADSISAMPLSNYEGSLPLGVCLGEGPSRYGHNCSVFDSPEQMAKEVISYYWSSRFTALDQEKMHRWANADKLHQLFDRTKTLRNVAMIPKGEELSYGTQH